MDTKYKVMIQVSVDIFIAFENEEFYKFHLKVVKTIVEAFFLNKWKNHPKHVWVIKIGNFRVLT